MWHGARQGRWLGARSIRLHTVKPLSKHVTDSRKAKRLYFVDSSGIVPLDTAEDEKRLLGEEYLRVFHLDANVALDFAKFGQGRIELSGVPHLTELARLASDYEIALQWDLGVAELAYDSKTHSVVPERSGELARAVRRGLSGVEAGARLSKSRRCLVDGLGVEEIRSYLPVVESFYTHLLKIELLARAGLSRRQALKSLRLYVDWANNSLRSVSTHALQLACNVFGGDLEAAKVLRIGSSEPVEARARNAAWDLTHAFAMHYETSQKVGKKIKQTILVTRDRGLSYFASSCIVAVFVRGSPLGDMTLTGYRLNQPHFISQTPELRVILDQVMAQQKSRIDRGDNALPGHIRKILRQVEMSLADEDGPAVPGTTS